MTEVQHEEKRVGMRDKPQSEMTQEDLRRFMKPLGLPGLPFPMADLKKNDKGGLDWEVGMISSAENALWIPSEQSAERVYGKMLRACPTPQMMLAFRKLLSRLAPDSTNCLISVFGERSSGKSHIIKEVGAMVHPEGCVVVDCGGLNMRELFWRTVIDYGQGVKEQLEKRIANGKISQSSLDMLETEFPGSIVSKGAVSMINWDAIGARRTKADGDGNMKADEDRGDAVIRATNLLNFIFEKEGISVKSNAFGIKTVPGELYESFISGRPPFLDEFNKSQKGTLDAYQTFLEWANGNDKNPVIRIPNPMATTDADSPKHIEFDRRKKKLGWFIGIAGNDTKDGATTQALSESMEDRLSIIRIGDPALPDWGHRLSQIYTGFPLKTWYDFFETDAKTDPEGFAKTLVSLRLLGLTATERKLVAPHEIEALKNFHNTVEAVTQLAEGYHDQQQLAKPESDKANDAAFKNCQNELAMGRKNIKVSFRTAIQEHGEALKALPEVMKKGTLSLMQNLSEVFENAGSYGQGNTSLGWHKLGANIVRVRQEAIANATVDMPLTAAALVTLWETNGVFPSELKEAKQSQNAMCISDLLKYDEISNEGLGDTDDLEKKRDVLLAAIKSMNPGIKATPEQVIPLKNLALAVKALAGEKDESAHGIVLPNEDLDSVSGNPVVAGAALPLYDLQDPMNDADHKLVDFRTALAALAMPGYAEKNREHIWPVELLESIPDDAKPDENDIRDIYDPLRGKSAYGFDICILGAAGKKDDDMSFLYVLEDKERDEMIIAGPEAIDPELSAVLGKSGITYVVKDDDTTASKINEFMKKGNIVRFESGKIKEEEDVFKEHQGLLLAFSAICRLGPDNAASEGEDEIPQGMNIGEFIHQAKATPNVFTSVVKRMKVSR